MDTEEMMVVLSQMGADMQNISLRLSKLEGIHGKATTSEQPATTGKPSRATLLQMISTLNGLLAHVTKERDEHKKVAESGLNAQSFLSFVRTVTGEFALWEHLDDLEVPASCSYLLLDHAHMLTVLKAICQKAHGSSQADSNKPEDFWQ